MNADNQFAARLAVFLSLIGLVACGYNYHQNTILKINSANLESRITFAESVLQKILEREIRRQTEFQTFEFSIPQSNLMEQDDDRQTN